MREQSFAYLDGTLPDATGRAMAAHLAACPDCRRFVTRDERCLAAVRRAAQHEAAAMRAPASLRDRVGTLLAWWRMTGDRHADGPVDDSGSPAA